MSGWNEDDWGTPNENNANSWDDWNANESSWDDSSQEQVSHQQPSWNDIDSNTEQDTYWNNQEQYQEPAQPVPEGEHSPIKLGSKMVAVILSCTFLVVALVLVVISNMGKDDNTVPQQQGNNTQQNQQQVQQNSGGMIEIPNNIHLDYSGEIYSTNATVRNKVRYKDGNQVIYCLELTVNFGTTSEVWNYYCSYSAFSSVKIRDSVYVEYQVPQEGYISIVSVSK